MPSHLGCASLVPQLTPLCVDSGCRSSWRLHFPLVRDAVPGNERFPRQRVAVPATCSPRSLVLWAACCSSACVAAATAKSIEGAAAACRPATASHPPGPLPYVQASRAALWAMPIMQVGRPRTACSGSDVAGWLASTRVRSAGCRHLGSQLCMAVEGCMATRTCQLLLEGLALLGGRGAPPLQVLLIE